MTALLHLKWHRKLEVKEEKGMETCCRQNFDVQLLCLEQIFLKADKSSKFKVIKKYKIN